MEKSARSQYLKLIDERINDTNVHELIAWVRNSERKPAILSFTEGPARQLAYAIEAALKLEREACAVLCERSDRYRGEYFAAKIRERSNIELKGGAV